MERELNSVDVFHRGLRVKELLENFRIHSWCHWGEGPLDKMGNDGAGGACAGTKAGTW